MLIEILGPGCERCSEVKRRARQAVKLAGIEATVRHISDSRTMAERRVMLTPAVALDGTVKLRGNVPSVGELVTLFINHLAATEGGGSVNYAADPGVGK